MVMTGARNSRELFEDWQIEGFIHKPFQSEELLAEIDAAWNRRLEATASGTSSGSEKLKLDTSLVILTGERSALLERVKIQLEFQGFNIISAFNQKQIFHHIIEKHPHFILCEFQEDLGEINATPVYRMLQNTPEAKGITFLTFCHTRFTTEAARDIPSENLLIFSDVTNLLRDLIDRLYQDKPTRSSSEG